MFTSFNYIKARKAHKCDGCGELIKPGVKYEYCSWKDGGEWGHSHVCKKCQSMREEFMNYYSTREYDWEEVHEFIEDLYCSSCAYKQCDYDQDYRECNLLIGIGAENCPFLIKRLKYQSEDV